MANPLDDPDSLDLQALSRTGPAEDRVADRVYRRLRHAILSGKIEPRTRLVETEVAKALDTSRTPVREAISRLTSDQLVVPLPITGVTVVDTSAELADIYSVRAVLEGCAARFAAERATEEEIVRLEKLVAETLNARHGDPAERVRINSEFHIAITEASRSPRLISLIVGFRDFFLSERTLERYTETASRKACEQHAEIVEAIRMRNGNRAERLVRQHLEKHRKIMLGK
jgi:DNA-binding GntR family transcriptional regulator